MKIYEKWIFGFKEWMILLYCEFFEMGEWVFKVDLGFLIELCIVRILGEIGVLIDYYFVEGLMKYVGLNLREC